MSELQERFQDTSVMLKEAQEEITALKEISLHGYDHYLNVVCMRQSLYTIDWEVTTSFLLRKNCSCV